MIALYPGSFDPPHLGHLDIIRRAAAIAERLIVAVAVNPDKSLFLSIDQRVSLLRDLTAGLANVEVDRYLGATVAYAARRRIGVLIRGVRSGQDLEQERALAIVNRTLGGLETVLLPAAAETVHLSGRLVREALAAGLPVDALVPAPVAAALRARTSP
ncbi:MAG: pantetheine-phosphate adenylyltransferase [Planctomycetes bacterium]|nr:pantetheine-phosphate adenylyltransferase [Planctomycetota bacterium]